MGFQFSKVLFNSGSEIKTQIPFDQSAHGKEHLVPCCLLPQLYIQDLGQGPQFPGQWYENRTTQEGGKRGRPGQCEPANARSCVLPIPTQSGQEPLHV